MRRPDLSFFSGEQVDASAASGVEPIPEFLIEVISPTDDAENVEEKLAEYFNSSVKVACTFIRTMRLCMSTLPERMSKSAQNWIFVRHIRY